MTPVLTEKDATIIRSLPLPILSSWAVNVYKEGYKDGLERAEDDLAADAEVMSCDRVIEKLIKADFTEEEANYILEVLLG